MNRSPALFAMLLFLGVATLAACGNGNGGSPECEGEAPTLDVEPGGAPAAVAGGPETRLTCLGNNAPPSPDGDNLTLPGWIRRHEHPHYDSDDDYVFPGAQVEAFDEDGFSLGTAFNDTGTGRVSLSVAIPDAGFHGNVVVSVEGFVDVDFYTSRPVTNTDVAGWAWLVTPEEQETLATDAGETLEAGKGVLVGAIHDCNVFGVENAVVRFGGSTDGVVFFDGFDPDPDRTFSAASGRFAVANVDPGPLTVEAFGRLEPGGPLVLLSLADVVVTADAITSVDLQPRVCLER